MVVDKYDCLVPIYFAKDKEIALEEYKFYSSQGSMEHRGHKKVIFSESTQVAEHALPMGELVSEDQSPINEAIFKKLAK
jgi:hypothetical protein